MVRPLARLRTRVASGVDEVVDRAVEVVVEFVIGDAVDLPVDATSGPIAGLVLLRLLTATVPADVVDLEAQRIVGSAPSAWIVSRSGA